MASRLRRQATKTLARRAAAASISARGETWRRAPGFPPTVASQNGPPKRTASSELSRASVTTRGSLTREWTQAACSTDGAEKTRRPWARAVTIVVAESSTSTHTIAS